MSNLQAASAALQLYREHFPESTKTGYGTTYRQRISSIRSGTGTIVVQRMGYQLMFLNELFNKRSQSGMDATDEANIKSSLFQIIQRLDTMKLNGSSTLWKNTPATGDPGDGIILSALVMTTKGDWYTQTAGTALKNQIRALMNLRAEINITFAKTNYQIVNFTGSNVPTVRVLDTGVNAQKFAQHGLAGCSLIVGSLGLYSCLSTTHTSSSQYGFYSSIYNYGVKIMDNWATKDSTGQKASLAIGADNQTRSPFPSSGYSSLVGMGLSWMAYGITYTPGKTLYAIPNSRLNSDCNRIGNYYKDVLAKRNHAPHIGRHGLNPDRIGLPLTAADITLSKNHPNINNQSTAGIDLMTTPENKMQETGYLYVLAWGGDQSMVNAIDKAVSTNGEASLRKDIYEATANAYARKADAASHRVFGLYTAAMVRGLTVSSPA